MAEPDPFDVAEARGDVGAWQRHDYSLRAAVYSNKEYRRLLLGWGKRVDMHS